MKQKQFNEKTVMLLEKLVQSCRPWARHSEPKHGIIGDPMADDLHELQMAVYDGIEPDK
jgi:hypothetical protein